MPTQRALLVAVLALAAFAPTLLGAAPARADWIVEQLSNAAPGMSGETRVGRQEMHATEGRVLIVDKDAGRWAGIVRLDERKVYELDMVKKTYFERPFSYYEKHRSRRDREHADIRRRWRNESDDRVKESMKAEMIKSGIAPDGKTVAQLERTGETRQIGPWAAERVIVRENGKVVFDMWVTRDLPRPEPVFALYRGIGLFAPEVVGKTDAIDGFPIAIDVRIDVGGPFAGSQHAEVIRVREVDEIPKSTFEIPDGFEKVDPPKSEGEGVKVTGEAPPGATIACAHCKKVVSEADAIYFLNPLERFKKYPVCSDECKKGFARSLKKR